MPLNKLSQKSFVNGQYDRTAQNQESTQNGGVVARGLSYAKNVLSSDRGELRKRLGTKFLKQLPGTSVIVPFRMNDENDAILVIDKNNITGYKYTDGGLIKLQSVSGQSDVAFPANNTWADGTAATGSVTNGNWTLGFSFPKPTSGIIPVYYYPGRLINGNSSTGYPIKDKPAPQYIELSNSVDSVCMQSIKLWFWTDSSVGYQYNYWGNPVIEYSDDGSTWVGVQTDYTVGEYTTISYTPAQNVGGHHIDANYKSKCSMTITQTNYGSNHRYWRVYFQSGSAHDVLIDSVSFIDSGVVVDFVQSSPYSEEQLKNIKYSQDKNTMFISCDGVSPYKFENNNGQLSLTAFTPMIGADTVWSLKGGYPAAVSLFQNRVWFGGFQNNPQTVIASKFDDYSDFTVNSPLQKDDSLELRCNQLKCKIKNLVGGQNVLCCFSEDGISYIDGGSTGLLATNENIEFKLKNRMPAGSSTPGFKDDVMLYSSSDGTKLYGMDFDLLVNRFQVGDLAIYAKDVTQDKVTELHYVNNESKLVYGLTEAGKMFALLYEKGAYQGFFPMNFGDSVYDIASIKIGRDYKLVMIVFRDGQWILEEKLDCGHYIDTSTPRLTDEEKKWATYDNLENNIALDCYQNYDESIKLSAGLNENNQIVSDVDLSSYVDKSVMFDNADNKNFSIYTIDAVNTMVCWGYNYSYDGTEQHFYTIGEDPVAGDALYDSFGNVITDMEIISSHPVTEYGYTHIVIAQITTVTPRPTWSIYMQTAGNKYLIDATLVAQRGNLTEFSKAYPEFDSFEPKLPVTINVGASVVNGDYTITNNQYITSSNNLSAYQNKRVLLSDNLEQDYVIATIGAYSPTPGAYYHDFGSDNGKVCLLCYGNGKYIAYRQSDNKIATSTDGVNWTAFVSVPWRNTGDGSSYHYAVYGGGKFVVIDGKGYISTSADGITWTNAVQDANLANIAEAEILRSIIYDGEKFVIVTTSHHISTSSDGVSWAALSDLPLLSGDLIAYGAGKYVVIGNADIIVYSTDGSTWTQVEDYDFYFPAGNDWQWVGLVYDGEKFIAVNKSGYVSESADGVNWSARTWKSEISSSAGHGFVTNLIAGNNGLFVGFNYGYYATSVITAFSYAITVNELQGNSTVFHTLYPDFMGGGSAFAQTTKLGIISEGRYLGEYTVDENGSINLPASCHKLTYGVVYESLAIFKIQTPYESMKQVAQVDVSVINTTHLEIGTSFDDTQYIEKIDDSSYYDLTRITMNDTYRVVVSDTPEMTKNVILRSNKGVPFTVNAVDMYISYSNLGGD